MNRTEHFCARPEEKETMGNATDKKDANAMSSAMIDACCAASSDASTKKMPYMAGDAKLLILVLEKRTADQVMDVANAAGAVGGTVLHGRGTAKSTFLRLLGLDDVEKELLYMLLPADRLETVRSAVRKMPILRKKRGLMFSIDVFSAVRFSGVAAYAMEGAMTNRENFGFELISVIVNRGNSDQVMEAAWAAGAKGGTVINARGTARPGDARFFGVVIVPEKEYVLILSPREDTDRILKNIRNAFVDAAPGSGIAFRIPVESFETLGEKQV